MDESFGTRLKKTAEEVALRLNDAAQQASERIGEMREVQRISQQIRTLTHERDRCRLSMADMAIRMFDQNAFAEALLQPEYQRIKEIDEEIARLEEEKACVGQEEEAAAPDTPAEHPEEEPAEGTFPCEE